MIKHHNLIIKEIPKFHLKLNFLKIIKIIWVKNNKAMTKNKQIEGNFKYKIKYCIQNKIRVKYKEICLYLD